MAKTFFSIYWPTIINLELSQCFQQKNKKKWQVGFNPNVVI